MGASIALGCGGRGLGDILPNYGVLLSPGVVRGFLLARLIQVGNVTRTERLLACKGGPSGEIAS